MINCVAQLLSIDGHGWNMELLTQICEIDSVELIKKLEWPTEVAQDKLLWRGSTSRGFFVRDCYEVAHKHKFNATQTDLWKKL